MITFVLDFNHFIPRKDTCEVLSVIEDMEPDDDPILEGLRFVIVI